MPEANKPLYSGAIIAQIFLFQKVDAILMTINNNIPNIRESFLYILKAGCN
jgi:hypothetical protein